VCNVKFFFLRRGPGKAENVAVRVKMRFRVPAAAILGICLAAVAQTHDRDSLGIPKTSVSAPAADERVDINHASFEELLRVPGMTSSWASRIVRFRPYRTKLDLMEQGVVTGQVYQRIKDYVIAHRDKQ
jgi:DNA uptake protein ComE-like DNA-binding protein